MTQEEAKGQLLQAIETEVRVEANKRVREIEFETKEEAIAYAEKNSIPFRLEPEKEPKRRQISYAENFRYDRKTPWTH